MGYLPSTGDETVNRNMKVQLAHLAAPGVCDRLDLLLDLVLIELGLLHKGRTIREGPRIDKTRRENMGSFPRPTSA